MYDLNISKTEPKEFFNLLRHVLSSFLRENCIDEKDLGNLVGVNYKIIKNFLTKKTSYINFKGMMKIVEYLHKDLWLKEFLEREEMLKDFLKKDGLKDEHYFEA